jgi:hypothetical protein
MKLKQGNLTIDARNTATVNLKTGHGKWAVAKTIQVSGKPINLYQKGNWTGHFHFQLNNKWYAVDQKAAGDLKGGGVAVEFGKRGRKPGSKAKVKAQPKKVQPKKVVQPKPKAVKVQPKVVSPAPQQTETVVVSTPVDQA